MKAVKFFIKFNIFFLFLVLLSHELCFAAISHMRSGNDICIEEQEIIDLRTQKAQKVLSSFLERTVKNVPTIAFVGSGGGMRSAITQCAFMNAFNDIRLIDVAQYYGLLSGSTWFMTSWLAKGFTLKQLRDFLREELSENLKIKNFYWFKIAKALKNKKKMGQRVTFTDLYGQILAEIFFKGLGTSDDKNKTETVHLSDLASVLKNGNYPFPIFTAVLDGTCPYEWFEFSSFEAGSTYFSKWIPIETFGMKYENGSLEGSTVYEQSLGYMIGMFSSAFSVDFHDLVDARRGEYDDQGSKYSPANPRFPIISKALSNFIGRRNPIASEVFNFVKGIEDCGAYSGHDYLDLKDAGEAFNLPFPPMLRRGVNLYFVCDASKDIATENALQGVEKYAKKNGYKFPNIDYTDIAAKPVSVFYDHQDHEVPIIVYFPNRVNFDTTKFCYTKEEFDSLYNTMYSQVMNSREVMVDVINKTVRNLELTVN